MNDLDAFYTALREDLDIHSQEFLKQKPDYLTAGTTISYTGIQWIGVGSERIGSIPICVSYTIANIFIKGVKDYTIDQRLGLPDKDGNRPLINLLHLLLQMKNEHLALFHSSGGSPAIIKWELCHPNWNTKDVALDILNFVLCYIKGVVFEPRC